MYPALAEPRKLISFVLQPTEESSSRSFAMLAGLIEACQEVGPFRQLTLRVRVLTIDGLSSNGTWTSKLMAEGRNVGCGSAYFILNLWLLLGDSCRSCKHYA